MGDQRRRGRNDSQCYAGNYPLILVLTEEVMIQSVDLKDCVDSACQLPVRWDDCASETLKTPTKL